MSSSSIQMSKNISLCFYYNLFLSLHIYKNLLSFPVFPSFPQNTSCFILKIMKKNMIGCFLNSLSVHAKSSGIHLSTVL